MIRCWFCLLVWTFCIHVGTSQPIHNDLKIAFDIHDNTSSTYWEVRQFYQHLGQQSDFIRVYDFGMTDIGQPLQEVIIAADGHFTPEDNIKARKAILFINNGIHPGEPEGIDASMLFARRILEDTHLQSLLQHVTIVIIPVYNIDGCLNRTGLTRPSQNGPELYGFRGNAKNLDLNRDFIKCDTKNAYAFNQLFNKWYPDVLIDTHSSNGSDYQHSFTLIHTHKAKLHPTLSRYLTDQLLPYIYREMATKGWDIVPYVMSSGSPENGIYGFLDSPRYSSGYAALHHTLSFMPETHMLKPYKERVASTLDFLNTMLNFVASNKTNLKQTRASARVQTMAQDSFTLSYVLDPRQVDSILFQGYQADHKVSLVSGQPRLYYDRSKPWKAQIPYYDAYQPQLKIKKPIAYVVPQAYDHVLELMQINGVRVERLERDSIIEVEMYKIIDFETAKLPYEGHYIHSKTQVDPILVKNQYFRGDYVIYTAQASVQYIIQTLEPQATDSWFSWNAFDGFLMQKEYYSDYVFEDIAADYLEKNPDLRIKLERLKLDDPDFAKDGRAQLDFVYRHSPYFEPTFRRYPVGRIIH
ncbi:MAG: hypothetical protein LC107_05055 [Chitinophagales bacterium]|nr:hypothetical protein [Chitinophagales bacterium]